MEIEIREMVKATDIGGRGNIAIPLLLSSVKAGFPSQADDYIEKRLDFNELLVKHPAATFCVRVSGDSMINAGIFPGDILVVDRSLRPVNKMIVIAVVEGELTVKRLLIEKEEIFLMPENSSYGPIRVNKNDFEVWGVVTYVLHRAG